jgi:hypothetical protein
MKHIYLALFSLLSFAATAQQTFNGNTRTGFGGAVGTGSIQISTSGNNIIFTFTRGGGPLNDAVVLYIDSKTGGFTSTAGFQDAQDGLRKAISGYQSPTEKSVLTFPSGFVPDYAVAFSQHFAGVWMLVNGTNHQYVNSGNLTPTGNATAATYTITVDKAWIGITGTPSFGFLGSYISETAYRSNEFIGSTGPTANIEYTDYTATGYNIYSGPLPVNFANVQARTVTNKINVSWTAMQEVNVVKYEIYRAGNNNQFAKIGEVAANNFAGASNYVFEDVAPMKGKNYYKIVSVDRDERTMSTGIVSASFQIVNGFNVVVLPGSGAVQIDVNDLDKGEYSLRIINAAGQVVHQSKLMHQGGDNTVLINAPKVSKGIYRVTLNGQQQQFSESVMVR